MTQLYKTCSFIYRIVLVLIIPLLLTGQFLVSVAGHNRDFDKSNYISFVYIILTVILLTIFQKADKENKSIRTALRYVIIALVLISIGFEMSSLYDIFLICKCFTIGDNIISAIIILFTFITTMLLIGLVKDKI